jgi:L-lysine 2,3-aminomutase
MTYGTRYSVSIVKIVVMPYYLGHNDKKQGLYMFGTDASKVQSEVGERKREKAKVVKC